MTIKQKYNEIDQSKLPKSIQKVLKGIERKTNGFTDSEANKVFESKIDNIRKGLKKKYPEALGKKGDTSDSKIESALKSINKLIESDPVLKGFKGSDIARDKDRKAKASGKRISKDGNIYYEYRENRTDRYAPEFPKDKPFLQKGGNLQERYIPLFINDYIFEKDGQEISYKGWGIYDTKNGAFTNLSTDREQKPYVLSFSTAKEIAEMQNNGKIKPSAIYIVRHLRHRYNKKLSSGGELKKSITNFVDDIKSLIISTTHKLDIR